MPARCPPFVSGKRNLWRLDGIARRYGQRPSSLLGMDPASWAAWQVDQATWEFGEWLDGMLSIRDKHGKPKHKLSELLAEGPATQTEKFTALGGLSAKRMAIPESGVW
jgi:hypothetical protein